MNMNKGFYIRLFEIDNTGDDDIDEEWIREFNEGRRCLEMARDDIVVSKAITSTQSRQANAI